MRLMVDHLLFETDFKRLADKKCLCSLTIFAHRKGYYSTAITGIVFEKAEATFELRM